MEIHVEKGNILIRLFGSKFGGGLPVLIKCYRIFIVSHDCGMNTIHIGEYIACALEEYGLLQAL